MISDRLMLVCIIAYAVIAGAALCERRFNLALYWIGAMVLTIAVLRGLR